MVKRGNMRLVLIALSALALVVLLEGFLAGVSGDWMRMALYLSGFTLDVLFLTAGMVILAADKCVDRIAARLEDTSGVLHRPYRRTVQMSGLAVVMSLAVLRSLSWFVGLHGHTLALGIFMTISGVVALMGVGVVTALAIRVRFERFEELLCK
jgi:hypothetical protein